MTPAKKHAGVTVLCLMLGLLGTTACKRNPIDRLTNPLPDGDVSQNSGVYIIYDDELKTSGGLGFFPGGSNQFIDLADITEPRRTARNIRYFWTGAPTGVNQSSFTFAGFALLVTPDFSTLEASSARNFSSYGYSKLKFSARGSLASDMSFQVSGPSTGTAVAPAQLNVSASQLTNSWQDFELTVPSFHFSEIRVFATFALIYDQPPRSTNFGPGGTVYIDDVRYE